MKKIVLTYGDINGIGFEVAVKALNKLDLPTEDVIIAGAQKVFEFYKKEYGLELNKDYEIAEVPVTNDAFDIGKENKASGEHCFQCLKKACELAQTGVAKNIVTATVSKNVLNMAGHNYSGQTEVLEHFLAQNNEKSEMLFVAEDFRVMLLTRHVPIAQVSSAITKEIIVEKILRLNSVLKEKFNILEPKIGLLALNPHAGENGLLGEEERDRIIPAVENLKGLGVEVSMPLVADAAFAEFGRYYFEKKKLPYDCYVSMYHDQGLIPMKLLAQDNAVNTTIGLSALRTSPSHGTAFDIAGKNIARPDSMVAAIELAIKHNI